MILELAACSWGIAPALLIFLAVGIYAYFFCS